MVEAKSSRTVCVVKIAELFAWNDVMAGTDAASAACCNFAGRKPCGPGCRQTQRTVCICFVYQFDGLMGNAAQTSPGMCFATNERMYVRCSAAAMRIWFWRVMAALCRLFVADVSKLCLCLMEDVEYLGTDSKIGFFCRSYMCTGILYDADTAVCSQSKTLEHFWCSWKTEEETTSMDIVQDL